MTPLDITPSDDDDDNTTDIDNEEIEEDIRVVNLQNKSVNEETMPSYPASNIVITEVVYRIDTVRGAKIFDMCFPSPVFPPKIWSMDQFSSSGGTFRPKENARLHFVSLTLWNIKVVGNSSPLNILKEHLHMQGPCITTILETHIRLSVIQKWRKY
ncbi:hypothetical protein Cgig2_004313 [Carnegiea gigantea]|uniref:Uncharacterized protein n=1 Tax=Carnegiea gigantea TaxID=171969 RepID=A0A9Q1GTP2_9CARY|nr:hypothetical protein Cgig2_004313 [Carnegiea gigantea]